MNKRVSDSAPFLMLQIEILIYLLVSQIYETFLPEICKKDIE